MNIKLPDLIIKVLLSVLFQRCRIARYHALRQPIG